MKYQKPQIVKLGTVATIKGHGYHHWDHYHRRHHHH